MHKLPVLPVVHKAIADHPWGGICRQNARNWKLEQLNSIQHVCHYLTTISWDSQPASCPLVFPLLSSTSLHSPPYPLLFLPLNLLPLYTSLLLASPFPLLLLSLLPSFPSIPILSSTLPSLPHFSLLLPNFIFLITWGSLAFPGLEMYGCICHQFVLH